jgi:glycosyltransferase involved in cell wall biosynthesis
VPGTLAGGGIGTVTLSLADALARAGARVDLLTIEEAGASDRPVPSGVAHRRLAARTRGAWPAAVAHLRATRPDLTVSARNTAHLTMLAAHRAAGRPGRLAWHLHTHAGSEAAHARPLEAALARAVATLARAPDRLVAVSEGIARDFERRARLAPGTVRAVPNPAWSQAHERRRRAPPVHPWLAGPRAGPVILGVGRLAPQKGFATLLDALALLRARRPARLVLLGEGPLRAELSAQIARLGLGGAVDMPGQVADPLPEMAAADLFVLSSLWEGLPTALIEAAGCGCPVVATDCPSGPAEILGGGEGPLVPPGDAPALAAAMAATLAAPPAPARLEAVARRYDARAAAEVWLGMAG